MGTRAERRPDGTRTKRSRRTAPADIGRLPLIRVEHQLADGRYLIAYSHGSPPADA